MSYNTSEEEYFRLQVELERSLEETYGISLDRLRELAAAERDGRVVVLNEVFRTPIGQYGFIYYNKNGLMMGKFRDTESEAAAALAEKGK